MQIDVKDYLDTGASAITTDGATPKVLNFGAANPNIGDGTKLKWRAQLDTAFTSASATVTLKLEHSANNSDWVDLIEAPAIALNVAANQVAKDIIAVGLPDTVKQYVRGYYTCSTTVAAGKIKQWIGH